jgi:hypothetical protein
MPAATNFTFMADMAEVDDGPKDPPVNTHPVFGVIDHVLR